MRKHTLLFALMLFASAFAFGQKDEDFTLNLDGSYSIQLVKNEDNTYGYEISQAGKLLAIQKVRPYSFKAKGFLEKQNAIAVALWHVKELKQGRNNVKAFTLAKAKELFITDKDLKD